MNATLKTLKVFSEMMRYLKISNIPGANYQRLKNRYMRELMRHLNLKVAVVNAPQLPENAIFVCNHISYLDIPIMIHKVPQAALVSKSEVAAWPIIGAAATRIGTVFVKRQCKKSRTSSRDSIVKALVEEKKSIGVFPSGTTKIVKSESWRRGVFEIAHENKIPVVPMRINYEPLRKAAYIDKDNLVIHLWQLFRGPPMKVTIEFGEARHIHNPVLDSFSIQKWCEAWMAEIPVAESTQSQTTSLDPALVTSK